MPGRRLTGGDRMSGAAAYEYSLSLVLGFTFLFTLSATFAVLLGPVVALSVGLSKLGGAECDQPLAVWLGGLLAAFALTLFMACWHQWGGESNPQKCAVQRVLCQCLFGGFVLTWTSLGTVWYIGAEDCRLDLKRFTFWAVLLAWLAIPALGCAYCTLVCLGTAVIGVRAERDGRSGGDASVTVGRPTLRRGAARKILVQTLCRPPQPQAIDAALCARCGGTRIATQSGEDLEAGRFAGESQWCQRCRVDEERHTLLEQRLEGQRRAFEIEIGGHAEERREQTSAELRELLANSASEQTLIDLQRRLDVVSTQVRRQHTAQLIARLHIAKRAQDRLLAQAVLVGWRDLLPALQLPPNTAWHRRATSPKLEVAEGPPSDGGNWEGVIAVRREALGGALYRAWQAARAAELRALLAAWCGLIRMGSQETASQTTHSQLLAEPVRNALAPAVLERVVLPDQAPPDVLAVSHGAKYSRKKEQPPTALFSPPRRPPPTPQSPDAPGPAACLMVEAESHRASTDDGGPLGNYPDLGAHGHSSDDENADARNVESGEELDTSSEESELGAARTVSEDDSEPEHNDASVPFDASTTATTVGATAVAGQEKAARVRRAGLVVNPTTTQANMPKRRRSTNPQKQAMSVAP